MELMSESCQLAFSSYMARVTFYHHRIHCESTKCQYVRTPVRKRCATWLMTVASAREVNGITILNAEWIGWHEHHTINFHETQCCDGHVVISIALEIR